MAAILRLPDAAGPGVISFTTQERDNAINAAPEVRAAVESLKMEWLVGLHHNWHDHSFRYDPLFDFSFAGDDDLHEVNGTPFPVIGLDACNFTPEVFTTGDAPFWDVLFVARAVYFKRIPEFFRTIRSLYDDGHMVRVLLLSPMPPYDPADEKTAFYGIRAAYERLFSPEEQDLFTLITMDWRYPFPLDLPTLAHFYRSSRIFVHTADDERRCRVAAYAWTSGLPVVGPEPVGSLLPSELRCAPWFFEAATDSDLPSLILDALRAAPLRGRDLDAVRAEVASAGTRSVLVERLAEVARSRGISWSNDGLALERLDIRLGRHNGLGVPGPNRVDPSVAELVEQLANGSAALTGALSTIDPERALEQALGATPAPATGPGSRRRRFRR
jgi:glycosyltransferase involved in cell wall biosynthesis